MKLKDKKEFERRNYSFEVRAEEMEGGGKIITGRPIVYGSRTDMGYFDEIIDQGALNETDLTDVRFLVNHNIDMIPLARSRRNNGNSTMQLSVDMQGMSIDKIELDTENNMDARALYSAVERGDITGMSFMFTIDDYEWEDLEKERPLRRIKKIGTVIEVSAVTFPAYEATEINARCKEALESARAALESAREARAKAPEGDLELLKLKAQALSM